MRRFVRKSTAYAGTVLAGFSVTALLPAGGTPAVAPLPCAHVNALCAWTGPGGSGEQRVVRTETKALTPPVRSVRNLTNETWCLYEGRAFSGTQKFELTPYESRHDLGFAARSARPHSC
ncbi:peptidase inhibitor family I36 protein [Streptomyces iconiensis]|uniref:Peptidase inhibitor family I36 protein n=1 Tax=Streptomyces iconiensis TaxID=1384038 RepID=A0ABT6ZX64_9ACTN|nr:peptidase inhibitor family I36 protein [Streptomyces iconiensis]MDJ1133437.1 peptidase inhibitor family I36 protein [Streptomyces iconiensis]